MAFDATTETIAHFVGLFQLTLEEARLRDKYLEIQAAQRAKEDLDAVKAGSVQINAGYRLEGYTPSLSYTSGPYGSASVNSPVQGSSDIPAVVALNSPGGGPRPVTETSTSSAPAVNINFVLPLPSSLVAVTVQTNELNDSDVFNSIAEDPIAAAQSFGAALTSLHNAAQALEGFDASDLPANEDGWQDFVAEAVAAIETTKETATPVDADGLKVSTVSGADAQGIVLDGDASQTMVEIDDLLPAFFSEKEDEIEPQRESDDAPSTQEETETPTQGRTATEGVATSGTDTSGGILTSAESDAVATSDTTRASREDEFDKAFDDREFEGSGFEDGGREAIVPEIDLGHEIVAGANTQINEIQLTSSWLDADVIAVAGDVNTLDAISQVNLMVTHDILANTVVTATSTAVNAANIGTSSSRATEASGVEVVNDGLDSVALPSNAVTVHIEGDVTQVNWTQQYSFTADNDVANVTLTGSSTFLGLGQNIAFNETYLSESGFNYDLIMVGGQMNDITLVSQTNVLLDVNEIIGDVVADVGDNLQANLAQIESIGVDTFVEIDETFADALIDLETGAEDIAGEIAGDDIFSGVELLRVLYIAGDLNTVTISEQTNILGDVDQVSVAQTTVLEAAGNLAQTGENIGVSVVAGSNAQINVVSVTQIGVDSTIMVGGNVYSDALIHQAGLIENDGIPDGVELSGQINALVNEAVAFLADDMLSIEINETVIAATETFADTAGQSDIMQTVLA